MSSVGEGGSNGSFFITNGPFAFYVRTSDRYGCTSNSFVTLKHSDPLDFKLNAFKHIALTRASALIVNVYVN